RNVTGVQTCALPICLRRADGGRQGDRGRRGGQDAPEPDQRDQLLRGRERLRRVAVCGGGQRLPHLRVLLRDVHRELDELPDRGEIGRASCRGRGEQE